MWYLGHRGEASYKNETKYNPELVTDNWSVHRTNNCHFPWASGAYSDPANMHVWGTNTAASGRTHGECDIGAWL